MDIRTLQTLHTQGLIDDQQHALLKRVYDKSFFSLYYELRTILYFAILLFTSGIGILIYKNIDTIGHQAIIAALCLVTIACFWHTTKHKQPYSNAEVKSPGMIYEYILLLGCLVFATLVGYVQYQYGIFSSHWALSTLIPALVFLFIAYAYDHRGILSLGVAGLASTLGLTISPVQMIKEGIFSANTLILSELIFGTSICMISLVLDHKNIKRHFTFTLLNLGSQVAFISCLFGLFNMDYEAFYFILLMAFSILGMTYALKEKSFLFLLSSCFYGYIGLSYMIIKNIIQDPYTIFGYFISSCSVIIYCVFKYKKALAHR